MSGHRRKSARTSPRTGRRRSIRSSLIALALVPATALIVLWASGSAVLLNEMMLANAAGQAARTTYALVPVIGELQKERQLTIVWLASGGSRTALDAQRRRTDALLAAFRSADAASGKDGSAQYQDQLGTVRNQIAGLTAERATVDGGKHTRQNVYAVYSATVLSALNLFGMLPTGEGGVTAAANNAQMFMRATEALSQECAVLAGVAASGQLNAQERADLISATAVRDYVLTNEVAPYLPSDLQAALAKVVDGQDWAALVALAGSIPTAGKASDGTIEVPAVSAARAAAPGRVAAAVEDVENQYLVTVMKDGAESTESLSDRVYLGSAFALAAVLAVGLSSYRITRSLIGRMSSLRGATLELAQGRLPELITRLRTEGSRADLDELPELDYGNDELGKVAEAFNTAQRTAVNVALEQAKLREGARLVFLNMSRRTQVLVHRQLSVIDSMERKEQDPELLSDLYRVDHLATRMRRNAESLTVLSGATPRRRWKEAVPLGDVLRSAVSEIEGYTRVVIEPLPLVSVSGPAVGDTIHLMAELIENGVTFSPPHTEVRVRALAVAQGFAIEVEDRGLGLLTQEYATANGLLHDPPDLSFTALGEDPRLGLFTIGHLAQRHGITVTLQPSSYGGSLAVVVLPHALTEPTADAPPMPLDARADRRLASVVNPAPAGVTPSGMPKRNRTAPRPGVGPAPAVPMVQGPAPATAPAPAPEPAPATASAPATAPTPATGAPPAPATAPAPTPTTASAPAPATASAPAPSAAPAPPAAAPSPSRRTDAPSRLPRRVRQAHLAPQLLKQHTEPGPSREAEERRPERTRSMLAALQDGTRRARAQEEVSIPTWPPIKAERRPLPTRPRPTRNAP